MTGRVGKGGVIYLPRKIREAAGVKPGNKVLLKVENGDLEIDIIPSLEKVLKMGPIAEISIDE